jgi:hypothetical protein
MKNTTLSHLSNDALVAEVARLAQSEHDATVALVVHLAELGARRLFEREGFSSLFEYCREVLGLSEGEAYNRVVAARAVRKFPEVLERLTDGSINLTTIRILYKHLTAENHRGLIDASGGKSKRDVERLIATYFPQPAVPFSVRKVPAAPTRVDPVAPPPSLPLTSESETPAAVARSTAPVAVPSRPAAIKPIAEDLFSVRFTATATTWEKLQAAQDLLRHSLPGWRRRADLRPGAHAVARGPRPQEVRRDNAAPAEQGDEAGLARSAERAHALGVGTRLWSLQIRQPFRTPMLRTRAPGVSPPASLHGRREAHAGEHRAALPRAQRLRAVPPLPACRQRA